MHMIRMRVKGGGGGVLALRRVLVEVKSRAKTTPARKSYL